MYNGDFLVFNYNNLALPSVFQSLLQEFEDIFQDKEIPPIKGTEHKIYFIPRAVIPYKPAYQVNPTETKEIQRAHGEGLCIKYRFYQSLISITLRYVT